MTPRHSPKNPHWPPSTTPSLGGAPHGLQSSESEGAGTGRCVAILCGGPSGGHNAAVLNAVRAFEDRLPWLTSLVISPHIPIVGDLWSELVFFCNVGI